MNRRAFLRTAISAPALAIPAIAIPVLAKTSGDVWDNSGELYAMVSDGNLSFRMDYEAGIHRFHGWRR